MERLKKDEELAAACDEMRAKGYTEHVAGDVCVGDEAVTGTIVRDGYGAAK